MTLKRFLPEKSRAWFSERQVAIVPPTLEEHLFAYKENHPMFVESSELIKAYEEVKDLFKNDIQFDPYWQLGLIKKGRSNYQVNYQAEAVDIKAAYRRLALEHHPDRPHTVANPDYDFAEIAKAYHFLLCPLRRRLWIKQCNDPILGGESLSTHARRRTAQLARFEQRQAEQGRKQAEQDRKQAELDKGLDEISEQIAEIKRFLGLPIKQRNSALSPMSNDVADRVASTDKLSRFKPSSAMQIKKTLYKSVFFEPATFLKTQENLIIEDNFMSGNKAEHEITKPERQGVL
ncbi:MAG: DnaJ domain, partial [Gammaproteobacteria bacterium]|nr:DnaJ domain [Gammaproteobacteria bacterium]